MTTTTLSTAPASEDGGDAVRIHDFVESLLPESGLRIGGARTESSDGTLFAVLDPATEKEITRISDGTVADALRAVEAAAAAGPAWAATAPRTRSEVLRRAFELMVERADVLAALISLENGKALPDARGEVLYAAEFFRWYSEEAVRPDGNFGAAPAGGVRNIVTHHPVGVSLLVTPWNFPAAMAARKIGPALAAGCTVVLKPASDTPLTALAIVDILAEAGAPAGTVNFVPGRASGEIVEACLKDERVRKLSFTGSTPVGRALLRQAAERIVNCSMELGGNAPFVLLPGSDIDGAIGAAMVSKFRNAGQSCVGTNRFYVHDSLHDEFVAKFTQAVSALAVGPATDPRNTIGPLVSDRARQGIAALVERAVEDGASIAYQASTPDVGFYYPPTVLTDVQPGAEIVTEEIFGPVAPIVRWSSEDEVIAHVNGSEMGLAAYVYGADTGQALRFAERIDAGMVGINRGIISDPSAPFGGTKQSGLGREGAREGLREFQETQYFSVDWSS